MITYHDLYTKSRAIAVEGETISAEDNCKICKLNLVEIDGESHPADYCPIRGWTYYDFHSGQRKPVPDNIEILCEWDYPSRQIKFLQELDKELLSAKNRLGI